MKKKMTAIVMCICILAGMITGCNASDQKKTEARTKKEITIAVNSETGGMDPALSPHPIPHFSSPGGKIGRVVAAAHQRA